MRSSTLAAALAAAVLSLSPAFAHEVKVGDLELTDLWARATPPRAPVAGGFLTITNNGDTPDRLVGAATPLAATGEVHEMAVEDGVMTMRELEDGLPIPAGESVTLAPGGYHIMFIDLKEPFVVDGEVPVTLTFEKAGTVETFFHVAPIGAPGMGDGDTEGHGMEMDHGMEMNQEGTAQ